jgi:hypothetical protein
MAGKHWSWGSGEVSPRVDTIENEIRSLETSIRMTLQVQGVVSKLGDITRMLGGLLGPSKTCQSQASTVSLAASQSFTSSSQGSPWVPGQTVHGSSAFTGVGVTFPGGPGGVCDSVGHVSARRQANDASNVIVEVSGTEPHNLTMVMVARLALGLGYPVPYPQTMHN